MFHEATLILLTLFLINTLLMETYIFPFIKYKQKSFNKLTASLFFKQVKIHMYI